MRRLMLGSFVLCGCVKGNPAWDAPTTGTDTGADPSGATTDVDPTTAGVPTTGTSSATDPATTFLELPGTDASTGGTSTGDASTGDATTVAAEGSSSEPLVAGCAAASWLRLEIADTDLRDAGVVPSSMGAPCPWQPAQPDCAPLNFGETGFFRLVNDQDHGISVALLRFPRDEVIARIAQAGKGVGDLIGLRVELVVWEPKPQPDAAFTLALGMMDPDDWDWDEGDHDGQPLDDDDSSWGCKDFEKGDCQQWAAGDVLAGSSALGQLEVQPADAAAHDIDRLGDEYHAQLASEALSPALVEAYRQGGQPGLTVTIASPRDLGSGDVGIKLRESGWPAPALWAQLCDEWK